jgi:3-hydroxyacyl-CoA dehydrogenase
MACANAGISVRLRDATPAAIDAGMNAVRRNYAASVKRGRMTEEAVAERLARIQPQLDDLDHTARIVLVDGDGVQRVGYPLGEVTPERLAHDLRLLAAGR